MNNPEAPSRSSPLAATSAPLLLRLTEVKQRVRAAMPRSSGLSLVVLLFAVALLSLAPVGSQAQRSLSIPSRQCPSGCFCFWTLMFCSQLDAIPSRISPATKFVSITNSFFTNPVLSRSNFSSGYENVQDIAIQYTNLRDIERGALNNLRRVRYISLDHNELSRLPSALLRVLARAKFIALFANSWNCNRELAWLYEVYRSQPDRFGAGCLDINCQTISQVRCSSPPSFANLDFVNITFPQYQKMQTL